MYRYSVKKLHEVHFQSIIYFDFQFIDVFCVFYGVTNDACWTRPSLWILYYDIIPTQYPIVYTKICLINSYYIVLTYNMISMTFHHK